jgi:hypothetical protein
MPIVFDGSANADIVDRVITQSKTQQTISGYFVRRLDGFDDAHFQIWRVAVFL